MDVISKSSIFHDSDLEYKKNPEEGSCQKNFFSINPFRRFMDKQFIFMLLAFLKNRNNSNFKYHYFC